MLAAQYASTANQLRDRMAEIMREHPAALNVKGPSELFAYGLQCDDLQPSLAQACWAMAGAKRIVGSE